MLCSDRRTRLATLAAVALLGCRPVKSNQALLDEYNGRKYRDRPIIGCDDGRYTEPAEPSECIDYVVMDLQTCLERDEATLTSTSLDELARVLIVDYEDSGLSADDADDVVALAESIAGEPLAAAVRRCFERGTIVWDCASK